MFLNKLVTVNAVLFASKFFPYRNEVNWDFYVKKAVKNSLPFAAFDVKLWRDNSGHLHGQQFCTRASSLVVLKPLDAVKVKLPPCNECNGWYSTKFGACLEKFLFCDIVLKSTPSSLNSFESIIASLAPWRSSYDNMCEYSSDLQNLIPRSEHNLLLTAYQSLQSLSSDPLLRFFASFSFKTRVSAFESVTFKRWVDGLSLRTSPCRESTLTKKLSKDLDKTLRKTSVLVAVKVPPILSSASSVLNDETLLLAWKNSLKGFTEGLVLFNAPSPVAHGIMQCNSTSLVAKAYSSEYDPNILGSLRVLLTDFGVESLEDSLISARLLNS